MTSNASNPFASHNLRPGVVEYIFSSDESLEFLLDKLRRHHGRGQIVGPHGSGKSTLLRTLLPPLREAGYTISLRTYTGGQLRLDEQTVADEHRSDRQIVIIDGFEQLHPLARTAWRLRSKITGSGLIVTTHRPLGLPTIHRTAVSTNLALQVVRQLAPAAHDWIEPCDIEAALRSHNGNCRDALFALYDLYELRRRSLARANAPH